MGERAVQDVKSDERAESSCGPARLPSDGALASVLWRLHPLIVEPLRAFNGVLRAVSAGLHHFQYKVEGFLRPSAEWFDHEVDVQWQWPARQRSMFLERGVLNTLAIRPSATILEVCCGDGFNAHRFYAERASHVLAVDHSDSALRHARRFHARPNVEYRSWDIREGVPEGPFDTIVWDSAIHHFTLAEAAVILASMHRSLADEGVLSGYTEIEPHDDYAYSRTRFADPEALEALLAAEFAHVTVLETPDALRRNLYFFATDVLGALPFVTGIHQRPSSLHTPAGAAAAPAVWSRV
jgi:ubiquinone/menaquinone biosynthesis C-methylase UbiE